MRSAVASAIVLAMISAPAAAAPDSTLQEQWRHCADSDPRTSIAGCTVLVLSDQVSGADLGTAYFHRALAYRHQSLADRALSDPAGLGFEQGSARAIEDYDQAIRLRPELTAAYVNRGIVFYDLGQYDRAILDYDQAIRLDPDLAEAFNNRALAYIRKGRYDLGTKDFDRTIVLKKNLGNALITREISAVDAMPTRP